MAKLDKRRKYYLVLDCETATLPYADNFTSEAKKAISIAKPLIYDLGWTIVDKKGNIYDRKNFLISEIFSVPSVFNTAYYRDKRPLYIEALTKGEIILTTWEQAITELVADMEVVEAVGAYNAMFDFKKAIPFTELYIENLYSSNFHNWLEYQEHICDTISKGHKPSNQNFEPNIFRFRGNSYNLFCIWGLSCKHLINNDGYRDFCESNGYLTASKKYYSTNAENVYRYCTGNEDFIEAHTALNDAEIESYLLSKIFKANKNKITFGIIYFPFRIVGRVEGD